MLSVEGVRKTYGALVALDGVDLSVAAGEIVGLVGPNGAGKTSLVSIVAGLRRADAGRVMVADVDVGRHPDRIGPLVGLAPQELAYYPSITVRDNLVVFAELAGLRRKELRTRIDDIAAALGLTELLGRRAEALSGGQKRRLHTAMAMIHRPPLLLLDEPTVGADIESRGRLLEHVHHLARDEGAAVVYSTHYLPEVEQLGASVAVIDRGRVLARGSLADVLAQYAQAAVELVFADGERRRIVTDEPARAAADALASLGDDASRLTGVEIVQPTLEGVYLAVTGRRFSADASADVGADEQEADDDVAVA